MRVRQKATMDPDYLSSFQDMFTNELSTIRVPPIHLYLQQGAVPMFFQPLPIPYALREKVREELQRMVI